MSRPVRLATDWLRQTYKGLVELAGSDVVHETPTAWLLGCRSVAQPGFPRTPMLAASVVVPRYSGLPYHPAPSAPLADLEPAPSWKLADRLVSQPHRLNVRGRVVALHHRIDGTATTPLPWAPGHEAPGWWSRLARRYFPEFEPTAVDGWDDINRAVGTTGPDSRGLVWIRRELGGREITGHLVYVHNDEGQVVFLDPMTAAPAEPETTGVRALHLLRSLPGGREH
ncbi:toxin glutamine deamidase domain-containing protein [Streptomyces prasinopilosus]|uniref:Papain fold toxin 1, glutamine deamidase n=1 Tax=Streptomyces prasinopilosus TaxID=67344 RepID=A0A1G6P8W8_9ACTN|nr:toxin glutamine deamidase domain-containing protein [Streptomyces prasinopilosus]SDC76054.1 Papain fold toxin 1, glutamine deamidase [Streptomyces prasinopilosus]